MKYDLIGDIHGYSKPLVELLDKLGYQQADGVYRHPDRQAIFLGDFIDRGPDQRGVLDIVRPMINDGAALSVMGNPEFNAIAWFTLDPNDHSRYLREHSEKHRGQHEAFLDAFEGADDYAETIEWFRTLPLWLDLPGRGRALGSGKVKFTGQVLPKAKLVTYQIDIKRVITRKLNMAIADGTMSVDGREIYTAEDLRVGLFTSTEDF